MAGERLTAYCFSQELTPRPPMDAVFDHDYLLYATRGALRLTVDGQSWLLPPSFAAWIPAKSRMAVEFQKPVSVCSILVDPNFCDAMPNHPAVLQMSPMTREMIRYCKKWGVDDPRSTEAEVFFQALLNACARLIECSVDVKRVHTTDPLLNRAIQITEASLAEEVTISDVAKATGLSERTMQRRFACELGMNWSDILTRVRLIKAIELVSGTDIPIIQVAIDCGFNSLSAFNRAFKKFAGCTPREFRKGLGNP